MEYIPTTSSIAVVFEYLNNVYASLLLNDVVSRQGTYSECGIAETLVGGRQHRKSIFGTEYQ